MPHSSGGGSHGGGSHHSSSSHRSSHRSSGSGPSRRIRTGYFPGATRYRYYHRHKPRYVYANYDIRKGRSPLRLLLLLFYIPFFIAIVGMASETFRVPQRLSTDYDTSLVISDYIKVLGDTKALENSMMAFYDETGITPAVFTVYNEDWQDNYSSLENYSYDLYVNAFDDEKHWLIVYSQPQEPDENFNDWYWEGMQGDDTSDILTSAKADGFNSDLQRYLTDKSISVADAISRAFDNLTPKIMKKSVDTSMLFPFLFFGGFILIHAYFMVFHDPSRKYRNAEVCPENAPVEAQSRSVQTEQTVQAVQPPAPAAHEESCPYCGGSYVPGRDKRCPYCQSLLDYSHDTNE